MVLITELEEDETVSVSLGAGGRLQSGGKAARLASARRSTASQTAVPLSEQQKNRAGDVEAERIAAPPTPLDQHHLQAEPPAPGDQKEHHSSRRRDSAQPALNATQPTSVEKAVQELTQAINEHAARGASTAQLQSNLERSAARAGSAGCAYIFPVELTYLSVLQVGQSVSLQTYYAGALSSTWHRGNGSAQFKTTNEEPPPSRDSALTLALLVHPTTWHGA